MFQTIPYDRAEVIQVIRTTLTRRGDGDTDPIRVITQFWSVDGELLAEVDPCDSLRSSERSTNTPPSTAMGETPEREADDG